MRAKALITWAATSKARGLLKKMVAATILLQIQKHHRSEAEGDIIKTRIQTCSQTAKQSLRRTTQAVLCSMLAVVWLLLAAPSWAAVSTTTELSSSANPAVANQMVTLTMKVNPSTASGNVTLYADGSALSTLSLNATLYIRRRLTFS